MSDVGKHDPRRQPQSNTKLKPSKTNAFIHPNSKQPPMQENADPYSLLHASNLALGTPNKPALARNHGFLAASNEY